MSSPNDGVLFRKSRRLLRDDPEYEALENPELTFKQKTPQTDIKKSETRRKNSETESESDAETESESDSATEEIVSVSRHLSKRGQGKFQRTEKKTVLKEGSTEVLLSASHQPLFREPNQTKTVAKELHQAPGSRHSTNGRTPKDFNATAVNVEASYNNYRLCAIIFVVACIIIGVYFAAGFSVQTPTLQKLFPNQDPKLWNFISHGRKSSDPFVLLLVHSNKDGVTKCLASHVAKLVAQSRTQRSTEPVLIDGKKYISSSLLDLRPQVETQAALILLDVDMLPAYSAEFLHFILDVHEPWVPGAVYVLTMNIPSVGESPKNTFKSVHSHLTNKWSSQIKEDTLEALITRVSNFEYVVQDDSDPCS